MTTEEVIQMRIRSLQREIDDLERTKAVMVNETARKAIDLHIELKSFLKFYFPAIRFSLPQG